jgi:hypothetical protein
MKTLFSALFLLLFGTDLAHAQGPFNCGSGNLTGSIRGRAVFDSTDTPWRGLLFLKKSKCYVLSDSTGEFLFRNVPAGAESVTTEAMERRHRPAVGVIVVQNSEILVRVVVPQHNWELDCEADALCGQSLSPGRSDDPSLTDSAALRVLVLMTTMVGTEALSLYRNGWTPCMTDSIPGVERAFKSHFPRAEAAAACSMHPADSTSRLPYMHQTGTGRRAFAIGIRQIEVVGDTATASSSIYVGPLFAAGFTCSYRRESGKWLFKSCSSSWVS